MQPDPQPEFIVFRVAPELLAADPSWRKYHGRWEYRPSMPPMPPSGVAEHPTYTATATGRLETRHDGAQAEVFEIQPPGGPDVSDQTRKRDAIATARETLIGRYGTACPGRLRRLGSATAAELDAAEDLARHAAESLAVGTPVYLPNRLAPDQLGYAMSAQLYREPGPIVSIDDDGWAMVDLGRWGQFGCPLADLRPVEEGDDAA